MKSQVSFKFDGHHNKPLVIRILSNKLKGLKYKIENENTSTYIIYVASQEDEKTTFDACFGIQCFCVYDSTKIL